MICESCKQNPATVHLTQIEAKRKKETHLCEGCAKSQGLPPKFSVKEYLSGVQKPEPAPVAAPAAAPAKAVPAEPAIEPCPSCGITFADFRASGRFGCWRDYEHFRRGIVPLLEKIHGSAQHKGHVPARFGARLEREKQVATLQRELAAAVEREEYERAAELRDRIKGLERGA